MRKPQQVPGTACQRMISNPARGEYTEQLDTHGDVAYHGVKKFEKLHFGVFQRRVRHVVDERDFDALLLPVVIADRYHRRGTLSFGPARRNSASFYKQ